MFIFPQRKFVSLAVGLTLGLGLGFFCANTLIFNASPAPTRAAAKAEPTLSLDEIQNALTTADARPDDLPLQRKLGLGLYQYSQLTANTPYLPDIIRLLKRAQNPADPEVTFALGNTFFSLARNGATENLSAARECYTQLLRQPKVAADARAALGLSYFIDRPPQNERAVVEFRQALRSNPQHQGALQGLATALIRLGQRDEAAKFLADLTALNPQHPALNELRAELANPVK